MSLPDQVEAPVLSEQPTQNHHQQSVGSPDNETSVNRSRSADPVRESHQRKQTFWRTNKSPTSIQFQSTPTPNSPPDSSHFTVLWHNLTYKVDSRPWYTKASERCCRSNASPVVEGSPSSSQTSSDATPTSVASPKEKVILNKVCGFAKSGQLTGILGPSGAGKSTLLSCLFQNRTDGTSGQILVERQVKGRLKVCFIPQHDYLNEWLTVREDLMFVSRLKSAKITHFSRENSSSSIPTNEQQGSSEGNFYVRQKGNDISSTLIDHEANALKVADLLGLTNCLDVAIKNISGGQKKRLSIARELMSKPDVLILDEPTTGLDSLTCYKTMVVLRDLAQLSTHPMAVIVTIHQPPRSVFNLFDKTIFISKRGRVIYDDDPKNVVATLNQVAGAQMPVPNYNPASFLIEIASDESHNNVISLLANHRRSKFYEQYDDTYMKRLMRAGKSGSNFNQNWAFCAIKDSSSSISLDYPKATTKSMTFETGLEKMEFHKSPNDTTAESNDYFISYQLKNCLSGHSTSSLESFRHIFVLTHRSWLSVIRNSAATRSRFVFHTVLPLMMLLVFGDGSGRINNCPKYKAELGLQEMTKSLNDGVVAKNLDEIRLGAQNIAFFFMILYGFGMNIISCTASFYPLTMNMFKKETINGLYKPAPYFIGQMLAELPLELLFPTTSIIISYYLSYQQTSYFEWRMFAVAFFTFMTCYTIHALGLLCGAMFSNDVNLAVIVGQALLFPPVMLSGFLIRPDRMPTWMRYMSYTSFFRQGLFGIIASRYGFNLCDCDESTLPEDGEIAFSGIPPHVRNVLDYLFPKNGTNEYSATEIFDSLGKRFVKAQTFGMDIKTCEDVRPYPMIMFSVHDSDLLFGVIGLFLLIVVLKFTTFSIMKSFPHRID